MYEQKQQLTVLHQSLCLIRYAKHFYFKFPSISRSLLLCFLSSIHCTVCIVFSLYLCLEVDDSPHSSLAIT